MCDCLYLFFYACCLRIWVYFLFKHTHTQYIRKTQYTIHTHTYINAGLIPGNDVFGLVSKFEMYLFSAVFGANLGSVQSYARSVFSQLVPVGSESELFSLYEVCCLLYIVCMSLCVVFHFFWGFCVCGGNRAEICAQFVVMHDNYFFDKKKFFKNFKHFFLCFGHKSLFISRRSQKKIYIF